MRGTIMTAHRLEKKLARERRVKRENNVRRNTKPKPDPFDLSWISQDLAKARNAKMVALMNEAKPQKKQSFIGRMVQRVRHMFGAA